MPRNRVRTTDRGKIPQEVMEAAAEEVINRGLSVRSVAKVHGICHVSLHRFCVKKRRNDNPTVGYHPHNRVFNENQENILADYVKKCADLYYGLSTRDLRSLAFQCAVHYEIKFPPNWTEAQMASSDWLNAFLKRNPSLSIRRPEATSLARAMNFNRANVASFFNNLSKVLIENKFEAHNVYNVDETGVHTVQSPSKIIAEKGRKQVGAITSAERGTLVTVCVAVNATGNSVPPMFVFPRKNFRDYFIRGGPVGSIGAANGSGWMQGDEFLAFIKHFAKHSKPTKENQVLLLLDNHESHINLPTIEFCKQNGIVLLSFPPHCSHRLQPLDVGVYGPFKRFVNLTMDSWMKKHPGTRMTIYDIPEIVATALPQAATPKNIMSGFSATGIWPFNANVFDDSDYMPCEVTDQPDPNLSLPEASSVQPPADSPLESASKTVQQDNIEPQPSTSTFSPEVVRPSPKAGPLLSSSQRQGRKKGKSSILTSTPEKNALEEAAKKKQEAASKKLKLSRKNEKSSANKGAKKKLIFNKLETTEETSSEEEECLCVVCLDNYNDSLPNEKWVMCISCKKWAHVRCTKGERHYECPNCYSD